MTVRVQVLLTAEEREAFRAVAKKEGLSLSAWLRRAGQDRARDAAAGKRLRTAADLRAFFAECDARERSREPDWAEAKRVIEDGRLGGSTGT